MAEKSLKQKTVKGVAWSAIDNVSKIGVSFIVNIILARLLTPEDYGVIGLLMVFVSIFNVFVDGGFTNAIIRKENVTDEDYSTAFYTNMFISVCMTFLLFISAPYIAEFFNNCELTLYTRAISFIIIINALCIVQRTRLTRAIDFKTQTKVTLLATLLSGILGIYMAYTGYGVWSLIAQQLSLSFFNALLLWFLNKWRPLFAFSRSSFTEMWSFGWKLTVSGLLDVAWRDIYQIVIGRFYTPSSLGLYTRAKQFPDLFSQNITTVVQRVSYPVLSSVQQDKVRLKMAYKRIIKTTMLPTFVLVIGLAASSKSLVLCLLGEKWIECVPFLQLICFSSMLYPLHSLNLNMLQVQGRSDLFLKLEIIKKIVAIGPILLGIFIDIYWMIASSVLTGFFSYYLNAYYSGPFLNYSIKEQIKDILPSILVAITMAIPVYAMSYLPVTAYVLFPLQIIAGAFFVIATCEVKRLPEYLEIKGIVMPMINKIIKR